MRWSNRLGTTLLGALVTLVGAAHSAAGGQCRPVEAWLGPQAYSCACTYQDVDYAFCISARSRGTLSGEYHFYGAGDDWVEASPNAPITNPPYSLAIVDIKPPGHPGIVGGWGREVFHTMRGDLITDTGFVYPISLLTGVYGYASQIIGGTGHYAGATGWIAGGGDPSGRTTITGQVCTP